MKKLFLSLMFLGVATAAMFAQNAPAPVRIAIVGLTHDHAMGFIPRLLAQHDVELAGIVETNQPLIARYRERFKLDDGLFYNSLNELLAKTNIQAVAVFTGTFDHARVVEECAPHGIHVMMEKPMALNMKQARAIQAAASKGGIRVFVNYETTWYPGNQAAYSLVHDQHAVGDVRKVVVHDGHRGPKEIGCSTFFLDWLTDPKLNGGGALMDFGCYGADLMTWLMDGERPTSVFAVAQHIKPDVYPKVEDEGTIIVTYPKAQGIIQASWNWPFDRKDMEIYGKAGYVLVPRYNLLRVRKPGEAADTPLPVPALSGPDADPLAYLAAVVRGMEPAGLSSVKVNMVVIEILDAARKSVATGKRVDLAN